MVQRVAVCRARPARARAPGARRAARQPRPDRERGRRAGCSGRARDGPASSSPTTSPRRSPTPTACSRSTARDGSSPTRDPPRTSTSLDGAGDLRRAPGRGDGMSAAVSTFAAARAILAKDLRVELRTLQSVPAMVLFATTIFVIFRFGLDRDRRSTAASPPASCWSRCCSRRCSRSTGSSSPSASRAASRRSASRRSTARRCSPRRPPRCSSTWSSSSSSRCRSSPSSSSSSGAGLLPLIPVLLLLDLGLAVTGALISSIATNSRARDLLGAADPAAAADPADDRRRRGRRPAARPRRARRTTDYGHGW